MSVVCKTCGAPVERIHHIMESSICQIGEL